MNTDMYNTYQDKDFCYYWGSPKKEPDYTWDYGDTVTFNFSLKECGYSNEDGLNDKKAIIDFFNYRGEVIASKSINLDEVNDDAITISYIITMAESKKVFLRGLYTLRIQITDQTIADNSEFTTVLPMHKIKIRVK